MIKVIELFAGVGGFRIGLERASKNYNVVWSNQWEPSTKKQHASEIYEAKFPNSNHSNEDIEKVISDTPEKIPSHDLLVGGFPCQSYSIANTNAKGLVGDKGVLWWSIYNILKIKEKEAPNYILLENVDRLLKSPTSYRGRDFAIILSSLNELGYIVEWRVINAGEFGMPQKRKRTYIMAYKKSSKIGKKIKNSKDWIDNVGIMNKSFPMNIESYSEFNIKGDKISLSTNTEDFNTKKSPFETVGIMIDNKVITGKGIAAFNEDEALHTVNHRTLEDVLEENVAEEFYVSDEDLAKWDYLKGYKRFERTSKTGFKYMYSEGAMAFPDHLDRPSRTIITAEGGASPSRTKHIIKINDRYRRLTPIELERLNMFPDNHTQGTTDNKRAFLMGNALVIGVVEALGKELDRRSN